MQFNLEPEKIHEIASSVALLLLDVDGVLTDGKLYFSNSGEEIKSFSTMDGHGIKMLMRAGINVGIITGRESKIVENRCRDLGIEILFQGQQDKRAALDTILAHEKLEASQVAYAGDDLPDWPVLKEIGLGFAVSTAHPFVKERVAAITDWPAGQGAVREICDFLLAVQNKSPDYMA